MNSLRFNIQSTQCDRYVSIPVVHSGNWAHSGRGKHPRYKNPEFCPNKHRTNNPDVREMAYKTLVRPQLEYTAAVWDAYSSDRLMRAFAFLRRLSTAMMQPLPDYVQPNARISRSCDSMTYRQLHTSRDYYKYLFSPRPLALSSGTPFLNRLQSCLAWPQLD